MLKKYLLVAAATFALSACDFNANLTHSSGTIKNPYLEEPLTDAVQKYEAALGTSNRIASLLIDGDLEAVHDNYFSDSLKTNTKFDNFEKFVALSTGYSGAMLDYKPMQWSFTKNKVDNTKFLVVQKFLQNEKNKVSLSLSYRLNSDYQEIEGLALNAIE